MQIEFYLESHVVSRISRKQKLLDLKIRLAGKWISKTDLGSKQIYGFLDSFEFFGQYTFTWILTLV